MDKLLHHYEHELNRLRQATRQYTQDHPDIAAALELGPDGSTDPEVERLLQSVALLNASTRQSIENVHSDFHKSLLHALQPFYLRPLPSCGIAQVDTSAGRHGGPGTVMRIPRGAVLRGGAWWYTTAYDIEIAPIVIAQVKFQSILDVPTNLRLPAASTSALCITLETVHAGTAFDAPGLSSLRIFVDGAPALRASLLDAILTRCLCVCIEAQGRWHVLPANPFRSAGFARTESLLPVSEGDQLPRVLAEYSSFPEKFDFIDLDMTALVRYAGSDCRRLTLYIVLPNSRTTPLRQTSPKNLLLACTPVINLSQQPAQTIKIDGHRSTYPVVPSVPGSEIYSIDEVALLTGSGVRKLPPFHGTDHSAVGPFWQLDEQEGCAIKLVDRNQQPVAMETGTISVHLTCMNEQVPRQPMRLVTHSGIGTFPVLLLRPPTLPRHFAEPGKLCETLYATDTSLTAIKELFQLHDCAQAEGLLRLSRKPATAWIKHPAGLIHMDGSEYTLTVDEAVLREHSMTTLAAVLAMVFAARTHENRFIQLCLMTRTEELLVRTGPHMGQLKIA